MMHEVMHLDDPVHPYVYSEGEHLHMAQPVHPQHVYEEVYPVHQPYHDSRLTHLAVPHEATLVEDHQRLTYHSDLEDHHVIDSHYVDTHGSVPYHEHAYLTAVHPEHAEYEHHYAHPTADYGGELHLGHGHYADPSTHRILVEE